MEVRFAVVLLLPEPSLSGDSSLVPLPNGTFCFCLSKDSSLPFGCISLPSAGHRTFV